MPPSHERMGRITAYQLFSVLISAVVGIGLFAFPRTVMDPSGSGAPLAVILGVVPVVLAWVAVTSLARRFPDRTPTEYVPMILSRPVGWVYNAALSVVLFLISAMTLRQLSEAVLTTILPTTPQHVVSFSVLFLVAYFVRFDIQVFARVNELVFPVLVVLPLILISVVSMTHLRPVYLLPVSGSSLSTLMRGALMASLTTTAYMIGPFLLPSLNRKQHALDKMAKLRR